MGGISTFNPSSPQAQSISNLFVWNLVIAGIIFALILGLVIYIAIRYRGRPGVGEPPQVFGHSRLEITWTISPAVVLLVMFGFMIASMRTADPPVGDQPPDLVVTGWQWWWQVQYPASSVVTANEIHIPVGKRLLVRIEGGDVIHDFWVPQLGPKRDMVPGHPNHLWLEADAPGTYLGACAEYCGNRARTVTRSPARRQARAPDRISATWRAARRSGPACWRTRRRTSRAG